LLANWSHDQIIQGITLFKERVSTLLELVDLLRLVYTGPVEYKQSDIEKWITPETFDHLPVIISALQENAQAFLSIDSLSAVISQMSKRLNVKLVALAQPIRIALVGSSEGPGVFALMSLVGHERTITAIHALWNAVTTVRHHNK
jgi:glutamyl-tRNA synthetase